MKRRFLSFLYTIVIVLGTSYYSRAQTPATINQSLVKHYKVGIFAPLYLDSVFKPTGEYKYKETVPKFITPGLDFIHGAEIALDSMHLDNVKIDAYIYDSKSTTTPLDQLVKTKKLDSLQLIIGSVKDPEFKQLATFALQKNIPFISATYPNDGGITGNPFVVILNPTLKAHCEAIYTYILQNHGTDKILLCRKKGSQEDKVAGYFQTLNTRESKPFLKIETLVFDSTIRSEVIEKKIDSNRLTIIIGASLDESFATNLALACTDLYQTYPIHLIGMPNWEGFKNLTKKDVFPEFPIYYTSPYYNNKVDANSRMITDAYLKKFKGKPTDMAFKGFESVLLFTSILLRNNESTVNHFNDKPVKLFSQFNIRPVRLSNTDGIPDYFENKHLFFIKMLNGVSSLAW
jgi:hypothetical protein